MDRRGWCGLALLSAVAFQACAGAPLLGDARTLRRGEWQAVVESGFQVSPNLDLPGLQPSLTYAVRAGLSDSFDLGLRVLQVGAALEPRFQLLRTDVSAVGIDALVSASLGVRSQGLCPSDACIRAYVPSGSVAFVMGVNVHPRVSLLLGPRAVLELPPFGGPWFSAGGNVGVRIHVWKWVDLIPEYSALFPIGSRFSPITAGVVHQAGLGLAVSNRRQ